MFCTMCAEAVPGWRELKERIERLLPELAEPDRLRLKDHLLLHVELHLSGREAVLEALGQIILRLPVKEAIRLRSCMLRRRCGDRRGSIAFKRPSMGSGRISSGRTG